MKNIIAFLFLFSSLFASSQTQYIGAPNTTVVARGNMKVDSILYLPKREKTPTDTGALRYQISDSSLYVWTGNAWRKAKNDGTITSVSAGTGMSFTTITSTGSVSADTNVLSTKSYRQKGDDSLGAIIATKGTGTVTSVGSGYGINGGTITTTGTLTADTLNLATRLRLQKVGDSLGLLISNAGGGTVTGVSAGIGMAFTTITSSGAVNADTAILSTKAWRQKGIDSVSQNLGLYLPLVGGTLTGGLTGTTAAFTSSGSGNTFSVTHSSGSGIGVNIEKGGNGEGLYVNKTSGTGNAATIIGTLNATTLVKSGGTSSQYLMADGTTSTLTNPVTGTGITGYISKWTGTGTQDTSQLFQSAGFVGIGNTSPSYKLDITGTLRNTTGAAFATSSGNVLVGKTVDAGVKLDVVGTLRNTTGANFATTSGNVGIGTTSTLGRLHVKNEAGYNTILSSLGGFSGIFSVNDANAYREMRIDGSAIYVGGFSGGELYVGSGTVDAGNYKLQVKGQMHSTGLTSVAVDSGALTVGTLVSGGNKLNVDGSIAVSGATSLSVTSGNVGVGQTGANATEKIDINGRARVRTIDSTGTAMNMLYADADGVIKKAAVPSGGSGTVTSVATGFGLSGGTITTTGTLIVDSASVATRARVQKGIDSVVSIAIKGSGTTNTVPLLTGATTIGNSLITQVSSEVYINKSTDDGDFKLQVQGGFLQKQGDAVLNESGGNTGIGVAAPSEKLHVSGRVRVTTIDSTATALNMLYADSNGVIKKSAVPASGVSGSGTTNYLPKWTSGTAIGNSVAYDNGTELLINTTSDAGDYKLQVSGAIYASTTISTGGVNGETSKTWKLGSRRAASVSLDATQYLEVEVAGVLYYIAMITID